MNISPNETQFTNYLDLMNLKSSVIINKSIIYPKKTLFTEKKNLSLFFYFYFQLIREKFTLKENIYIK